MKAIEKTDERLERYAQPVDEGTSHGMNGSEGKTFSLSHANPIYSKSDLDVPAFLEKE